MVAALVAAATVAAPSWAGVEVTESAAGASPAEIQGSVDAFRALLGDDNGVGGSFSTGRREIKRDAVPDPFSAPNPFPGDFFNVRSARGAVFSSTGTGFLVSANDASGVPVRLGDLNPSYTASPAAVRSERARATAPTWW